jgi:hypothetical protein
MPGAKVDPWSPTVTKKPPRSAAEAYLMEVVSALVPGEERSKSRLKDEGGISNAAWKRLASKLRSATTPIGRLMAERGVVLEESEGGNKAARTRLIRR